MPSGKPLKKKSDCERQFSSCINLQVPFSHSLENKNRVFVLCAFHRALFLLGQCNFFDCILSGCGFSQFFGKFRAGKNRCGFLGLTAAHFVTFDEDLALLLRLGEIHALVPEGMQRTCKWGGDSWGLAGSNLLIIGLLVLCTSSRF